MARQAKSTAKIRLDVAQQVNREDVIGETAPTIEEVAIQLRVHVATAVATLGVAAAAGDVQAAKAILDFVRAADTEEQGSKGKAMLDRIAAIRAEGKKARGSAT